MSNMSNQSKKIKIMYIMTEKNKSFFINLHNPEEILKMKSDFLILFIKEDIINGFENNFILEQCVF